MNLHETHGALASAVLQVMLKASALFSNVIAIQDKVHGAACCVHVYKNNKEYYQATIPFKEFSVLPLLSPKVGMNSPHTVIKDAL